jgi:hypothetical protein
VTPTSEALALGTPNILCLSDQMGLFDGDIEVFPKSRNANPYDCVCVCRERDRKGEGQSQGRREGGAKGRKMCACQPCTCVSANPLVEQMAGEQGTTQPLINQETALSTGACFCLVREPLSLWRFPSEEACFCLGREPVAR